MKLRPIFNMLRCRFRFGFISVWMILSKLEITEAVMLRESKYEQKIKTNMMIF